MSDQRKWLRAAEHAHTNLTMFAAVVSLLEGGHLYGSLSEKAANRIIALAKREQQRLLSILDDAEAKLLAMGQTDEA